jgi:hypothetical protein
MSNLKKEYSTIEQLFEELNLGKVTEVEEVEDNLHDSYIIKANDKEYQVLCYSKRTLNNRLSMIEKEEQIKAMEYLRKNGVPVTLPLKFEDDYFISFKKDNYIIYENDDYTYLTNKDLDEKKIKKLANTQAIIHKLNIKVSLPCPYEKVSINFQKIVNKLAKKNSSLSKLLYDNIYLLDELVEKCNKGLKYAENVLCLSYDYYNLYEIKWDKDYIYLKDFENCALINPTVSLAEAAYDFTRIDDKINYDFYEEYLRSYLKKYGQVTFDYKEALNVSLNKQLLYLEELFKLCLKGVEEAMEETRKVIEELIFCSNNFDKLYEIYIKVVKQQ